MEKKKGGNKIGVVLLVILVLFAGLIIGRNIFIKQAVQLGVKQVTGLGLSIGALDIGILKTRVGIKDMVLQNPESFPEKVMVDIPEIYVDYALGDILKRNIHLEEVRFNLKEFVVVKNEQGALNLDSLKALQQPKEEEAPAPEKKEEKKGKAPQFQIDVMELKIGKVYYKDYSKGTPPKVQEFNINVDQRFENITDPQQVVKVIVFKALANTTIAKLTNFDVGALGEGVSDVLKGAGSLATEAVGKTTEAAKQTLGTATDAAKNVGEGVTDTLKKTGEGIKKIIPFGQ